METRIANRRSGSLSSVIDVISPKNGKALSIETLVSYEKKERAGEFSDYSEGDFK